MTIFTICVYLCVGNVFGQVNNSRSKRFDFWMYVGCVISWPALIVYGLATQVFKVMEG